MKHIVTLFALFLASSQIFGQASAVVFSEVGEKFTVYLNGEKQNSTPSRMSKSPA
jgi:hypothetical protein